MRDPKGWRRGEITAECRSFSTMSAGPPRFELISLRTHDVAVRDRETGEVMHPSVGPWNEASVLYVGQSQLAARLGEDSATPLHVWDVGLGAGTNAIAALTAAKAVDRARRFEITSFDTTSEALELALDHPEAFPFMQPWREAALAILAEGVWESDRLGWRLIRGDCAQLWAKAAPAQLVYFDPFSPQSNPHLWTVPVLRSLRAHASHEGEGTVLMTYSAATRTRVSLLLAGFFVGAGVGVGTRLETTQASTRPELLQNPLGERWLKRWERSDSRSPHGEERIPDLLSHPQFAPG